VARPQHFLYDPGCTSTRRFAINRIDQKFKELAAAGKKGLLPYITAGFPTVAATAEILRRIDALGAAGIEVGFPYSDSIADGPVIQTSFTRALEHSLHVNDIFRAVAEARKTVTIPLVAMVSFSIVTRIGVEAFCERAAAAGFDGLIIADLSLEEAPTVSEIATKHDLRLIMLTAPTSTPQRREQIAKISTGFVYYMSVAGITGERDKLPDDLPANVQQLRQAGGKPVVVGFGISKPQHVRSVCSVADGAIVGSAIVRRMLDAAPDPARADDKAVADTVEAFVRELMTGLP
jgi:tryptophan synthase alpha chain